MTATRKIVAIGGGSLRNFGTLPIDEEIVRLTEKAHPHVLIVPTATGDSELWQPVFEEVYGTKLGCTLDTLWLLKEKPSLAQIEQKIRAADIIWVGGGNTLRMMKRWRQLGVDTLLLQAYARGTVLTGISAGSICWFQYGHSDSRKFQDPANPFILVRGLGLIPAIHCPHYHSEKREQDFAQMIAKHGGIGIAIDDNCALEVIDDQYRLITAQPNAPAYKVYKAHGSVITEEIEQKQELTPLSNLLV